MLSIILIVYDCCEWEAFRYFFPARIISKFTITIDSEIGHFLYQDFLMVKCRRESLLSLFRQVSKSFKTMWSRKLLRYIITELGDCQRLPMLGAPLSICKCKGDGKQMQWPKFII